MTYLFEDDEASALSKLFRCCYNDTSKLVYSKGNRKLVAKVKEIISKGEKEIAVFIDISPDNILTYNVLMELIRLNSPDIRVFVAPIVCAEYHLLLSLYDKGLINEYINFCETRKVLDIKPALIDIAYKMNNGERTVNLENRCKNILRFRTTPCFGSSKNEVHNNYVRDVKCEMNCGCSKSLAERSAEYLSKYPYIPRGLSRIDNFDISRMSYKQYAIAYNKMADYFNSNIGLFNSDESIFIDYLDTDDSLN